MPTKPRVFVASSSESLDVAYAVQDNLERDAEVTVWTQGVMRMSRATVVNLEAQLASSDLGAFVLGVVRESRPRHQSRDDARMHRSIETATCPSSPTAPLAGHLAAFMASLIRKPVVAHESGRHESGSATNHGDEVHVTTANHRDADHAPDGLPR